MFAMETYLLILTALAAVSFAILMRRPRMTPATNPDGHGVDPALTRAIEAVADHARQRGPY